ncbi:TldD/PmbA family protein [bacterium]
MKTTKEKLLPLAEKLVAYGRKKGADEVEISIGEGSEFTVDVRQGEIEKLVEAGSKGLSLKVILDKRVATASSSDFSEETLNHLIENAISRAKVSSPDPFAGLPDKEKIKVNVKDLKIYDPKILEMPPEKKIATAKKCEKICLADKRIKKSYGASYGTYTGTTYLANSNGFSESYSQTTCSCGVYLQAGEGDNLFDEGKGDYSRNLDGLMKPEAIAKEAIHRVTRLIGAKKVKTQDVPVVMEPQLTEGLLGFLYNCINGNSVYLKQTFLADKLGEKIAGDNITVIDDGLMPGVPGAKPFDREGVPVRKTPVIEKGVLKNYLMDTYAARKLKMNSTGNASGANNLFMKAGKYSQDEIIKTVKNGMLLTGTIGFGLVPVTGDISRGAFGMWIENGKVTYPVAEITISGNLGEVLNNIKMVGNDLKFKRSINAPTILVEGITIGGK